MYNNINMSKPSLKNNIQGILKPYPLYEELSKRVNLRINKGIDIKRVCTTINSIWQTMTTEEAQDHYNEIAALILHHELLENYRHPSLVHSTCPPRPSELTFSETSAWLP